MKILSPSQMALWVKDRLRSRADTEHVMSLNRALFSLLMGLYLGLVVPGRALDALVIVAVGLSVTAGIFAHILFGPARSLGRRVVALVADITTICLVLHLGGELTSCFVSLILWTIFGNGFRFGQRSLLRATAVGTTGFAVVVLTTPYWRDQAILSTGLLLGLVTLPLYSLSLFKRLSVAKQQAEAANEAKSLFLASVSHELRTPLHAIIGMGSLLEQAKLPPEPAEMARTIMGASQSLLDLIDDVLKLSRVEAGNLPMSAVAFDLPALLADVRALLRTLAQEKGLRLALHVGPGTPRRVRGDQRHIREVLLNLASNALKFTNSGGVLIAVGTVPESAGTERLRFEVVDTGIGIAPEAVGRIFETFTQADPSITERFGGTGLGLAICRRVVEALGGKIGVESRLGHGSTFWFEVECVAQPEITEAEAVSPHGPLTVLSVDAAVRPKLRDAVQAWVPNVVLTECRAEAVAAQLGLAATDRRRVLLDGLGSQDAADATDTAVRRMHPAEVPPLVLVGSPIAVGVHTDLRWVVPTWLPDEFSEDELRTALNLSEILGGPATREADAAAPAQDVPARQSIPDPHVPALQAPRRRLSILVADDNRINQRVVAKILETAGHSYEVASDGEAALDAMENGCFDLVLMDANMPTLDGIEATKLYRIASLGRPRLPIVALTADATPAMAQRCKDAGMDGCITKPIRADTLLDLIDSIVPATIQSQQLVAKSSPPNLRVVEAAVLDHQHLDALREIGGDAFVTEVLKDFFADAQHLLQELGTAIETCDFAKFKAESHAIGSMAANVGAFRVSQLSLKMERMRDGEFRLHGKKKMREVREEMNLLTAAVSDTGRRSRA